jgi:hypothetical protein
MAELIAKTDSDYKNVLNQNNSIINYFDKTAIEAIEFTPNHKLEDKEWFYIANFSNQDFFISVCSNDFSTASLTQIVNNEYKKIQSIGVFQGSQKQFQRITPSYFVNRKTVLDYSGEPRIVEHSKQIQINKEKSDAIYLPESDTLYFKDISKIKGIFPGIEKLHREATQPEVDDFLNKDFISLSKYSSESVGTQNRKRIADIGEKYNRLSDNKKQQLIEYAKQKAGIDLVDNDTFKITSESDLKNLLYAIDQRYYYADIYEETRVANSIRVVNR